MKVFLTQDIKGFGSRGEIKEVNDGYARNFLIPNKLAVLPNDHQAKDVMAEKQSHQSEIKKQQILVEGKAKNLDGQTFVFQVKADKNGHLYGSIGPKELAAKINIAENLIKDHFKTLGEFPLAIKIGDQTSIIKIVVKKEK